MLWTGGNAHRITTSDVVRQVQHAAGGQSESTRIFVQAEGRRLRGHPRDVVCKHVCDPEDPGWKLGAAALHTVLGKRLADGRAGCVHSVV